MYAGVCVLVNVDLSCLDRTIYARQFLGAKPPIQFRHRWAEINYSDHYTDPEMASRLPNTLMPSPKLGSATLPVFTSLVWCSDGTPTDTTSQYLYLPPVVLISHVSVSNYLLLCWYNTSISVPTSFVTDTTRQYLYLPPVVLIPHVSIFTYLLWCWYHMSVSVLTSCGANTTRQYLHCVVELGALLIQKSQHTLWICHLPIRYQQDGPSCQM